MLVLGQGSEKPGKDFLGHVLRLPGIPQVEPAVPENQRIILADEFLNGRFVPLAHPVQQQKIIVHGFPSLPLYFKSAFNQYNE